MLWDALLAHRDSDGVDKVHLRMGSNADIVCAETAVEAHDALLLSNLGEAVRHGLVRELAVGALGLLLKASLDEVEWQREERGEEASNGRGSQGLGLGRHLGVLLELGLGLAEEGELTEVESHGTDDRGGGAGPEGGNTLRLCDAGEGVNDALVVLALSQGLEAIALHADQSQVGRVAEHGGQTSGSEAGGGTFLEAYGLALLLGAGAELAHEGVEEAQAGRGVDSLAEETSGQAGIEVECLAASENFSCDGQGSGLRAAGDTLAGKLDADLDHVDGLDDGGGDHATDTAVDEGQSRPHQRGVEEVVGDGDGVGLHDFGPAGSSCLSCLLEGARAHGDRGVCYCSTRACSVRFGGCCRRRRVLTASGQPSVVKLGWQESYGRERERQLVSPSPDQGGIKGSFIEHELASSLRACQCLVLDTPPASNARSGGGPTKAGDGTQRRNSTS